MITVSPPLPPLTEEMQEGQRRLLVYLLRTCSGCQHPEPWRALFAELLAKLGKGK